MSILIQRPSENIELKLPELTYIYRFCSTRFPLTKEESQGLASVKVDDNGGT